jgi:hypothetical protein
MVDTVSASPGMYFVLDVCGIRIIQHFAVADFVVRALRGCSIQA